MYEEEYEKDIHTDTISIYQEIERKKLTISEKSIRKKFGNETVTPSNSTVKGIRLFVLQHNEDNKLFTFIVTKLTERNGTTFSGN